MKKLNLTYNLLMTLSIVGLTIYTLTDKEDYTESKSNVLNTVLNSEISNDKPQKNKNIIIRNPDFTVAAEKTIYSVCLLYTSPSPRDKRQSRMPSSA